MPRLPHLLALALLATALTAGPPAAAAAEGGLSVEPLLELSAGGISTVDLEIPFCGVACDDLFPHFRSYQITVFKDGSVLLVESANDLEDPASGATSRVGAGRGPEWQLNVLRGYLRNASIGFEHGGCSAPTSFVSQNDQGTTVIESRRLNYLVNWHGRGNRRASFLLPQSADEFCTPELIEAIEQVFLYAEAAVKRDGA